jgi:hypothetical protein
MLCQRFGVLDQLFDAVKFGAQGSLIHRRVRRCVISRPVKQCV